MANKLPGEKFDLHCTRCPRLADFLIEVAGKYPDYHNHPVADFGPKSARLLIVGLAPGLHGANASGRAFTGDHAGIILYQTLHRHGFASAPKSTHRKDGMKMINCRITNAVKCLPPANKPVGAEINECNTYLQRDLATVPRPGVVIALGGIAHRAILKALGKKQSAAKFGHGSECQLEEGLMMISSYHCSRYNTQTKRLTATMFDEIFVRAQELV